MTTALSTQTAMSQIPPVGWVALGILGIFALVMMVLALIDLSRRTDAQVLGGRRWVWLLVILFVNSGLGAILYLAIGRKPAPVAETPFARPTDDNASAALDAIYGAPKGGEPR